MPPSPLLHNAYWIVLLPFLVGALIILLPFLSELVPVLPKISRDSRGWKTFSMGLSIGAVTIGFIHSILIFNVLAQTGTPYVADATWFQSSAFRLTTGLLIDNLTAVMLLVVTIVSLLVQIYTHSYMREDPGYSRFYAYLSLFTGSMLGLVVSTNLFQMYLFWELVGVCSYFLIGFWFYKKSAADACLKAFVVNRIGDFGFLVGILMLFAVTYGYWAAHPTHGILSFTDPNTQVEIASAIRWGLDAANNTGLTTAGLTVIALLIFMGPMAKSAQMPLHVWLPDAMEGPTPISALIHAATMVAAGVYMVARAYPIWLNWSNPAAPTPVGSDALAVVAWIGTFTAIMAATIALTQTDIKRILAWSTVSQLGYMFAGLGVGAFTGGIFHLFTHAFFKAMLFLCSGAVIHALSGEQDVRNMGGLRKDLKYTRMCFLIGCMAIMGFPLMSGFFSKDEIIGAAWLWGGPGKELLTATLIITSGLTAFYMFRCYFLTFSNEYRGTVHPHAETKLTTLTAPLVVLAVPSIIAGILGFNSDAFFAGKIVHSPFGNFVSWGSAEPVQWGVMITTVLVSFAGWGLAAMAYWKRSANFHTAIANAAPWAYQFSLNRWYWDTLYLKTAQALMYAFTGIWTLVDKFIVDNLVNASYKITNAAGNTLRYSENGRGQYYAMVIFACVAGISLFVYFTRP